MYGSYQIPFRKAHSFVSALVKKADEQQYNLKNISKDFFAEVYQEFFGKPFLRDFEPILKSIDPYHFVKCRDVYGGTGKSAMENMLVSARKKVENNKEWYEGTVEKIRESEEKRTQAVKKLINDK